MSEEKKTFDFAPRTLGAGFIHKKDLVLAIILVAFGAFMYYEAGKFPEAPAILGDTLNADVFPKMLITILFILVAIIPFEFKITPAKIARNNPGAVADAMIFPKRYSEPLFSNTIQLIAIKLKPKPIRVLILPIKKNKKVLFLSKTNMFTI